MFTTAADPNTENFAIDLGVEKHLQSLQSEGFFEIPGFFSESATNQVRNRILHLRQKGLFQLAGISKTSVIDNSVRRDETLWTDDFIAPEQSNPVFTAINRFVQILNQRAYLGLWECEGHYAVYPKGGFYRRHLDRIVNDDSRMLSIVAYFSASWQPGDGGELMIYRDTADQVGIKISPVPGTLVGFLSGQVEHEVLPNHSERLSYACWYKTRNSKTLI